MRTPVSAQGWLMRAAFLWLVTGTEKSGALDRLLTADPSIPAGRVSQDRAIVFAGRAATAAQQKAA